jgi:hypothetical protein
MQCTLGGLKTARRWVQNRPSYINNLWQVLLDMNSDTPTMVCQGARKWGPRMKNRQPSGCYLRWLSDAPLARPPCSNSTPRAVARNDSSAERESGNMYKRRELIFSSFSSPLCEPICKLVAVMCMSHWCTSSAALGVKNTMPFALYSCPIPTYAGGNPGYAMWGGLVVGATKPGWQPSFRNFHFKHLTRWL